jgi:glycoside/pentoside/hexuronide:cation symporter, GPH family
MGDFMENTCNKNSRIRPIEKIGYGLGDTASNVVFQAVMMFMAFFYTDVFGISAAAVGTLFLVVRAIDAVTDPIMGAIADRTNTRWGKFRPYLLLLCVPFAITLVLAFTTPDLSATGKLIYAYITYSLMMLVYTAINIPYCALGGVITSDPQERVSLNSYRFFLSTAAGVLIAATALKLVNYFGKGDKTVGFQYTMGIFAILAVVLFIVCFFLTKERVVQVSEQKPVFKKDIKYLFKNDQWLIVSFMTFLLLVPAIIRGGAAIYYIEHYLGKHGLITAFLTTGMVSSMIGASFASIVTKKSIKNKSIYVYTSYNCYSFSDYVFLRK